MIRRRFECVAGLGLVLLGSLAGAQGAAGEGDPSRTPRVTRAEEEARTIGARRAALAAALDRLDGKTYFSLPEITAVEVVQLADGDLVRRREPPAAPGEPQRVVALQWFDVSRSALWIACQDPHLRMDDSIENLRLSPSVEGHTVWYGLIDLPWPFKNRQWVIKVWDHLPLAEATAGESWEHVWQLDLSQMPEALGAIQRGEAGSLTPSRAEKAVVTPVNHGAWVLIDVDGGTLLIWHLTSSIGGSIPDRLVVSNAFHSVERLFRTLERLARRRVERHYRDDHPPLLGGDGKPIPTYGPPIVDGKLRRR